MGQLQQFNPESVPADQYTQEKGRYIAEEFAAGYALRDICENSEDWIPSMLIVRRWRKMFPAFDSMMVEAAECRAENMAEDILVISDDTSAQASHNRNRMAAREKLAGWMAPANYGDRRQADSPHDDNAPVFMLTDEQLLSIAAGKLAKPVIEGECESVSGEGVHPPSDPAPPIEYEVSGPKKPESKVVEHSVTTKAIFIDPGGLEGSVPFSEVMDPDSWDDSEKNFLEPGEVVRSFVGMDDD